MLMIVRQTHSGIQVIVYKSDGQARGRKQAKRRFPYRTSIVVLVLVAGLGGGIVWLANRSPKTTTPTPIAGDATIAPTVTAVAGDANTEPLTHDISSIDYVVNKKRPLPSDYAPRDLVEYQGIQMRQEAMTALKRLVETAVSEDYIVRLLSGYRSYADQEWTYGQYVKDYGQADADTFSARPGHSEHQTGLALDIGGKNQACDTNICFADTPLGLWLKDNAYKFGFIERYQKGKEAVTGYQFEPWHLRYVGVELASELKSTGKTLEEHFGLPGGDYN